METLFIYLIKSCGLIGMFYLSYVLLLRKETFFNSNRWFLLAGLITSVVLPLIVYTKIVWVDPSPTNFDWSKIPVTTPVENEAFEINWYLVFVFVYSIGILAFLMKFAFDFFSLSKVLKGKTIQHQADFKFIDVNENVSPFSYFNSIVYNSSLYSETELENILEHEKVHSAQNHTIDVLISRLFCIVFWFHPLMWLYKKAILQNLEFIADYEASKNISDKKAYQMTLLKITTQENCVAITNHFYQSLIKKRIVMLNKNQSNKRNSWKYALVLPLLGAFLFFFQVKVIAQEKALEPTAVEYSKINENSVDIYKINKNTTDAELKEKTNVLKEKYGVTLTFSDVERNSENELIAIEVDLKKGKEITRKMATKGTEPIKTFGIIVSKNENGLLTVDFGTDDTVINQKSVLISPNAPSVSTAKPIIIINGKKADPQVIIEDINTDAIQSINILKDKFAIEKYGKDGKNGVIEIISKENAELLKSSSTNATKETTKLDIIVDQQTKTTPSKIDTGWELNYGISDSKDNITKIKEDKNVDYKKAIIFIDGKLSDSQTLEKLDPEEIATVSVQQPSNLPQNLKEAVMQKYGEKALNGVITIETQGYKNLLKPSPTKAKKETELDKSDIDNSKNETVFSKERWLETYKTIWKARLFLEKMNTKKEQAKVELEKSKKLQKSKLFS